MPFICCCGRAYQLQKQLIAHKKEKGHFQCEQCLSSEAFLGMMLPLTPVSPSGKLVPEPGVGSDEYLSTIYQNVDRLKPSIADYGSQGAGYSDSNKVIPRVMFMTHTHVCSIRSTQ